MISDGEGRGVELQEDGCVVLQMEGFKEGGSDSSLSRKESGMRFESAQPKQN